MQRLIPSLRVPNLLARHRATAGAIVLATLALAACESPIPRVDPRSPALANRSSTELTHLSRGRTEYIAKCSGCHRLYRPYEGDPEYWRRWTVQMAERSKLSPDERERITDYLSLASRLGAAD